MGKKKNQCDCIVCEKWKESGLRVFKTKYGYSQNYLYFVGWGEDYRSFANARKRVIRKVGHDATNSFKEAMGLENFVSIDVL